jgi:uncharacterized protein with FMN-binding domain
MKRGIIIGTGAVCSLGAILLITPPQFGQSKTLLVTSQSNNTSATAAVKSTNKKKTQKITTTQSSASTGVSGTFDGDSVDTIYGPVQVQLTISHNKITAAQALAYPTDSFRDQQINSQAIPLLIQETLQAQSAQIQGVSGASYTSQGWETSLQSALAKAGM